MHRLNGIYGLVGAAVLALAFTSTTSFAKHGDIRFRCSAKGTSQMHLNAKYEERTRSKGLRKKFEAEFEAGPDAGLPAGQQVSIAVDSVVVGTLKATPAPSGEISGELHFDSKAEQGKKAFPANFPAVAEGSMVEALVGTTSVLGCQLQ